LEIQTKTARVLTTREAVALAWELTGGQPWLVNAVAAEAVGRLIPDRSKAVEPHHVERAKEVLVERRDTHLESLVSYMRQPRVRRVLEPILIGELLSPDLPDDDLQFVLDLGLVARGPNGIEVANPIYREVIPAS
jgi:hypothetical protein